MSRAYKTQMKKQNGARLFILFFFCQCFHPLNFKNEVKPSRSSKNHFVHLIWRASKENTLRSFATWNFENVEETHEHQVDI